MSRPRSPRRPSPSPRRSRPRQPMTYGSASSPSPARWRPRRAAGGAAGRAPRRCRLWHGDHTLDGVDAVILPGGFSYGDYLPAARSLGSPRDDRAGQGGESDAGAGDLQRVPVLCEAHRLPGASVARRPDLRLPRQDLLWSRPTPPGPATSPPVSRSHRAEEREGAYVADEDPWTDGGGRPVVSATSAATQRLPGAASPVSQRAGNVRRADAPPGAQRRPADRALGGRAPVLHQRAEFLSAKV